MPILNGTNHDEERIFVTFGRAISGGTNVAIPDQPVTAGNYQTDIAAVLGVPAARAAAIAAQYPPAAYPSPAVAFSALVGDANFACPALQLDSLTAKRVPTFAYEFNDDAAPQIFVPLARSAARGDPRVRAAVPVRPAERAGPRHAQRRPAGARGQHASGLGELRGQRQPRDRGGALARIRRRGPRVRAVARPATSHSSRPTSPPAHHCSFWAAGNAHRREGRSCGATRRRSPTRFQEREKIPCPAKLKSVPSRSTCLTKSIADLRRRVAATCWPSKELVADSSQGVQLATMQELARYWATDYDWRACEARLNALPQFKTQIDGLDIHFIHVSSRHENALPLIITHGWPGSVIELLGVVGPLTDPTAHGGSAEDAFDLVLPSLPGYGFSAAPAETGWDPGRVARAWAELMSRLGYTRYVAQGGDIGANVTDAMGRLAPDGLLGIHLNFLSAFPTDVLAAVFGGSLPRAGLFKRVAVAVLAAHAEKKQPTALDALARPLEEGLHHRDARAPADDRLRLD